MNAKPSLIHVERDHINRALQIIHAEGDVFEIRGLQVRKRGVASEKWSDTISGYFDDFGAAADAVVECEQQLIVGGWYSTLNPCKPELLARSANRLRVIREGGTKDHEILSRRWLPIDLDPKRPSGISATDGERTRAFDLASRIVEALEREGWPVPVRADSGNGAHVCYPIDLPNNDTARDAVRSALNGLAARFNTEHVELDRAVFNAARLWKLYGTVARKGDDIPQRPHRLAQLFLMGVRHA